MDGGFRRKVILASPKVRGILVLTFSHDSISFILELQEHPKLSFHQDESHLSFLSEAYIVFSSVQWCLSQGCENFSHCIIKNTYTQKHSSTKKYDAACLLLQINSFGDEKSSPISTTHHVCLKQTQQIHNGSTNQMNLLCN